MTWNVRLINKASTRVIVKSPGTSRFGLNAFVVVAFCAGVLPVAADSGVACVQEQLTALGADPGPVDGQFGGKTASAFSAIVEAYPNKISAGGDLNVATAAAWCATLGEHFPEAAAVEAKYAAAIDEETGGFQYDIGKNVPDASVSQIREGFNIARHYISATFGEEIPADIRRQMTVKVVATGKGNQEQGGGGGAATALAMNSRYPRPFFDVAHDQWNQNSSGRGWTTKSDNMKTVVHEYVHSWQSVLGAMTIHRQELGNWMNEGIAEFVAYKAMDDADLMRWSDVLAHMQRAASGMQTERPLRDFGTTQTPAWPGHVGFIAIDWLVRDAPNGITSLRIVAEQIDDGKNQRQAFAPAFGLELDDFYAQFEAWRPQFVSNPARAINNRPKLAFSAAAAVQSTPEETASSAVLATTSPQPDPPRPFAVKWFEQAMALDGKGGQSDIDAERLYRLAAKSGHAGAARNLAGMLASGRGVRRDDAEAAKWFRVAAEAGDAQGQYALAVWFLGNSVQDIRERISLLRAAAAQGHVEAIAKLEEMGVPVLDPNAGEPQVVAAEELPGIDQDPLAAEKCIQAGLIAAGYPVGAVDGIIGGGTSAAFEKFRAAELPNLANYPFQGLGYPTWCLAITAARPLSGPERAYQAQIERNAKVYVRVKVPQETLFALAFRRDGATFKATREKKWIDAEGFGALYETVLDYTEVMSADDICVVFEEGWVVLDQAGLSYQASCDVAAPALLTRQGQSISFNVEKRSS